VKKTILKQFFCIHIGMEVSKDSNFKTYRDVIEFNIDIYKMEIKNNASLRD